MKGMKVYNQKKKKKGMKEMNKNYNEIVVQQYHVLLSIKIFPRILVPSIPKKMGFCLFFLKTNPVFCPIS